MLSDLLANLRYLAGGFGYGVLLATAAVALWALLAQIRGVSPPDGARALSLLVALFFLVLTQYPLPDPATLDCTAGGVPPVLQPFGFIEHIRRLWRQDKPLPVWLSDRLLQSILMNLLLCVALGMALARHLGGHAWAKLLALAVLLSGGAELAQVTGLFGLYPCPYRQFDINDLIANIGGAALGFALGRHCLRRRAGRA